MKMAFLVICPGSFQYDGEREREAWIGGERERERERERETAEKVERRNTERNKTSEQREMQRRAFTELRKGHAAPFRAHYHS